MFVNIIASFIPILFLQFILLPIIGRKYDEATYGLMLTIISLVTLSTQSLSIALTNSRLLKNSEYTEKNTVGDFNILLVAYCMINSIVVSVGTYLYEDKFNSLNILLVVFLSNLQLIRKYTLVSFRLKINYTGILNSNIFLIIGYLIGVIVFIYTKKWEVVYIFGEMISLISILKRSNILSESYRKTILFKETFKHSSTILVASFLGTASSYIDRLILFPILGGKIVTVYYVSSLLGKTLSLLIGPINNVLLTYISKMKKIEKNSFDFLVIFSAILGGISYFIIIVVSKPLLKILYPLYVNEAMKLIYITTLTSIILMLSNVINPIIMKFCDIKWQMWINIFNNFNYIVLSLLLVKYYGIYGFCFAALMSSILKFILMISIYKKRKEH
ncbi:hypothetical protein MKD34_09625 (plasmid) [Cetobacterium somerae]|uniref:lipopolysaccharide biosynthesis protein n=1 Tax=Cetobacterium somerae TaxID=188913 RepID=UPI001F067A86|nr:hypothetical protein [Cetobacterium somerae]UPO98532.1 hypothetical protein MKD34_09625 [Cetobacterium somerae]